MHKKKKLLLKIISVILLIILIFAAIILISYETQHGSQPLINNNNFSNYQAPILSDSNSIEIGQIIQNITIDEEQVIKELEITIVPDNGIIRGFMQITINNYPYGTEEILVMISPENSDNPVEDENTFINFIEASFNTEFVIDSKEFPNGEYLLTIATTHDSTPENDPWTGIIKQEITISN
jgi:hypothetical protein